MRKFGRGRTEKSFFLLSFCYDSFMRAELVTMLVGFKSQLKITSPQTRELLAQHCCVVRHAYNFSH